MGVLFLLVSPKLIQINVTHAGKQILLIIDQAGLVTPFKTGKPHFSSAVTDQFGTSISKILNTNSPTNG